MYCDVVVSNNSMFIENMYTYKIPKGINIDDIIGKRVVIPFGSSTKLGLVISVCLNCETEISEVKELINLVDDYPILTNDVIEILLLQSQKTGNTISRYLNSIYPITFNIQRKTQYKVEKLDNIDLVLRTILPKDEFEIIDELEEYRNDIIKHVSSGNITKKEVYTKKIDYKKEYYVRYTGREPKRNSATRQEVIRFFQNTKTEYFKIKTLVSEYGFLTNAINYLIRCSVLERNYMSEKLSDEYLRKTIIPKPDKRRILKLIHSTNDEIKWEQIVSQIDDNIDDDRNVLMLVPDASSATLVASMLQSEFMNEVDVYHSKLSDRRKFDLMTKLSNNETRILVGAGGAAFLPLKNIGTIFVYESSDRKYLKSQYNFYDILSVANLRSKINNSDLTHVTSSPSISEYYQKQNDSEWKYCNLDVSQSFKKTIVDMREELKLGNHQILSIQLQDKLRQRIKDFETSFLLVNLKSDNSSLKCRTCGKTTICPHCGTNLKLSDKTSVLSCSSCNCEIQFQGKCIYCGSSKIRKMKLGIENVYEYVKEHFSDASVLMLTMDDLTSVNKMERLIIDIRHNKYDIVIGTKDIASLLPKKSISLVALIMIDITLNINSYKASELAFNEISAACNIISHSSTNELLIQTYEPNNKIINYALNNEYEKYYNDEIVYRKISKNPPYREIVYLSVRIPDSTYKRILPNLNLYVSKYFNEGTYFGPSIENKNGSSMIELVYTIKVDDINEVISFRKIINDAFNKESMFITIEHE